ncbi:MAG: hypothetical protein II368_00030, partial [Clostridia bacterium]|nr:hypothetical protein [Clostridia bacterium]
MKSQAIKLNTNWKFREWGKGGEYMPATVPGDVTRDMCNYLGENKLYVDFNYKKYKDFVHNDYEYVCTFDVPEDVFDAYHIYLEFLGVDTYSDIMINGISIGSTTNMFMGYRFDVKRYVKRHGNELTVRLKNIFQFMEENKEYVCIFERDRMFIRKASYQFGWDWAPNFPAYGIWQDVLLYGESLVAIENVRVKQNINGDAAFLVELTKKSNGQDLTLEIDGQKITVKTIGKKNIINAKIKNPKLWWPNGMGDQPLYDYKLTLNNFDKPADVYEGYMAFRKVEMDEGVIDAEHLNFQLKINNLPVFLSGSNWVPQDCLTGTVTDETYIRHIKQAKDANFNILRVWGGGVYEKEIFYRLCDENGIMILQETMFACSDVPVDHGDMMKKVMVPELEYQLKRLANHPCIVIWTGGNEIFSPFGENPYSHTTFTEYGNRGLVNSLTDFYYYLTSPGGYTDTTNMPQSGDAHMDSNEILHGQKPSVTEFRKLYNQLDRSALTTEAAIPCAMSYENMMRCTEKEEVWPIGPYLEERYGCNPFGGYVPFVRWEFDEITTMFGSEPTDVRDFIKKSFVVYAERLAMEIQNIRARGGSGFLNWMYEDTWPDGSWALVDYYGQAKSGLYAFARNFEPVGPTIYERREDGKIG